MSPDEDPELSTYSESDVELLAALERQQNALAAISTPFHGSQEDPHIVAPGKQRAKSLWAQCAKCGQAVRLRGH